MRLSYFSAVDAIAQAMARQAVQTAPKVGAARKIGVDDGPAPHGVSPRGSAGSTCDDVYLPNGARVLVRGRRRSRAMTVRAY